MSNEQPSELQRLAELDARIEAKRAAHRISESLAQPRNSEIRQELDEIRLRAEAKRGEQRAISLEHMQRVGTDALKPCQVTEWMRRCGIPLRYRELAYYAELVPSALRDWASGFPDSLRGAGALLEGGTGAGKTTAACWVLRELYLRGKVEIEYQYKSETAYQSPVWSVPSASFVHGSDLFDLVFQKQTRAIEKLESVDLLVIDDWGVAYESQWPLAVMDRMVDRRWAEMRSTIVTTNVMARVADAGEKSFEHRYPRSFSRICDRVGPGVVSMLSEDRRLV